jgi:hypothetical protein
MQLYNWFPQKYICAVLCIFFLSQYPSFYIEVDWIDYMFTALPAKYAYTSAGVMAGFAVLDFFTFNFNPLERNFIVDQESGTTNLLDKS